MKIDQLISAAEPHYNCFMSLWEKHGKDLGLSVILFLFAAMAIYKSTPAYVSHVFELNIQQNRTGISNINVERDITQTKTVWVDKLNLKDGYNLEHPKLGQIGFSGNYFIDLEAQFEVKKPGDYYLIPGSDDGFILSVDGNKLCEFVGDRGYRTQSCKIELDKGTHTFKLNYFQGGGHSGLTLAYRHQDMKKQKWFGEDSGYLKF